eukprot:jgi/Phyca11/46671/gw1.174.9.1
MERMLETFKTNITPAQAVKLFTAPKDPKRTWPEHYMYLVAVSEASGGSAEYLVLNNIVQYASADLRMVLMAKELAHFAQAWELESGKGKNLGREVIGHIRPMCPERAQAGGRKPDMTLALSEGDSDESEDFWILDPGSSRHLVNDASCLEDVEDCADQCVQPNGDALRITKKGSVTLQVTACGAVQTVKLTEVYYAKGVIHNLISYGQLDRKGFVLARRDGRRVGRLRPPAEVIMAALADEATGTDEDSSDDVQSGTLVDFHRRLGHLNYDAVERLARDPSSGIRLTDRKR